MSKNDKNSRSRWLGAAATAAWLIMFLGGLVAFVRCLETYPPYWNDDPLIWKLPLTCYVAGFLLTIAFRKKLLARQTMFPGYKALTILILPFAPAAAGVSLFLFLNGYLDASTPRTVPYTILHKHRYQSDFSLDLQSLQEPPFPNSIPVDADTYHAARPGGRVAVMVKNGYFNTPWIVAYQLEDQTVARLETNAKHSGWGSLRPKNTLEWFMLAIVAVYFIVVGGFDVWLLHGIARYMQQEHPAAWAALRVRSPYTLRFALYVFRRGYLRLNDHNLTKMFTFKSRFDNGTAAAFGTVLVLLLYLNGHGS
jgi:hypothetical protein